MMLDMRLGILVGMFIFLVVCVWAAVLVVSPAARQTTENQQASLPTASQNTNTTSSSTNSVTYFLVALDDAGKQGQLIGCNDSLVAVRQNIAVPGSPLQAALEALFQQPAGSTRDGGIYSAVANSSFFYQRLNIQGGHASVDLSGTYSLAGECDGPRFVAQIRQTILHVPGVITADITVNGRPLEDIQSLK